MHRQEKDVQWNIFARELQTILEQHGYRIGHLNDRAGIHPQKVARLQRSLRAPKCNVLTPDELDRVCQAFGLTNDERLRLRAAILVTAIEEMLMGRINIFSALDAANQILPIMYRILKINANKQTPLSQVKGGPMVTDENDPDFETILHIIDRATIALHLSDDALTAFDTWDSARQARDAYASAIEKLEALPAVFQENEIWKVWHSAAQQGLIDADKRLAGK